MKKTVRAFALCDKLDHVKRCQDSYGGSPSAYVASLETEAACGRFTGEIPVIRILRTWLAQRGKLEANLASKGEAYGKKAKSFAGSPLNLVGLPLKEYRASYMTANQQEPSNALLIQEVLRLQALIPGVQAFKADRRFLSRWRKHFGLPSGHQLQESTVVPAGEEGDGEGEGSSLFLAQADDDAPTDEMEVDSEIIPVAAVACMSVTLPEQTEVPVTVSEAQKEHSDFTAPIKAWDWPPFLSDGETSFAGFSRCPAVRTKTDKGVLIAISCGLSPKSEKGPQLSLAGAEGEVIEQSVQVAYNWVKSNSSEIERRYGPFVPDRHPLKDSLIVAISNALTLTDGSSCSAMVAAALVAFCLGAEVRPDVVVTGELTLSGHIVSVSGILPKLQAACEDDIVGTLLLPQDNYVGPTCVRDFEKMPLEERASLLALPPSCRGLLAIPGVEASFETVQAYKGPLSFCDQHYLKTIDLSPTNKDVPGVIRHELEVTSTVLECAVNMWHVLNSALDRQPLVSFEPFAHPMGTTCKVTSVAMTGRRTFIQVVESSYTDLVLDRGLYVSGGGGEVLWSAASIGRCFIDTNLRAITEMLGVLNNHWANTMVVTADDLPSFHVHFPVWCKSKNQLYSAAAAVSMLGVMLGRQLNPRWAIMEEVQLNGVLHPTPELSCCHIRGILQARIERLFVPRANAQRIKDLLEEHRTSQLHPLPRQFDGQDDSYTGPEVVAMENLLEHLSDMFGVIQSRKRKRISAGTEMLSMHLDNGDVLSD